MKPSGIGGMAVMEGVMMKNKDVYAVAVRKPNNEIAVEKNTHKDFSDKVKLFKLPIFRGMIAFVDSMVIGIKVLNYSASFFEEEEEQSQTDKKDKKQAKSKDNATKIQEKEFIIEELSVTECGSSKAKDIDSEEIRIKKEKKAERSSALLMAAAVLVSIVISVTLFMVLPVLISNLFSKIITQRIYLSLLEGILRIVIFISYVLLASRMPDIKRVFMYHGAEHKTINCLENGFELTVDNVKQQSKQHKRCGTSFMLLVMMISLVIFIFLPPLTLVWRILSRVLLVPIIAGISYEFIRLAGKSDSKLVNILSKPGLLMQGLTTKEPDDSMIEVAIQSVEAVFDWRGFLETSAASETVYKKEKKEVAKEVNKSVIKNTNNNTHLNRNTINNSANNNEKKAADTYLENQKHKDEAATVSIKPAKPNTSEEEDDEILRALDKYLDLKGNAPSYTDKNI